MQGDNVVQKIKVFLTDNKLGVAVGIGFLLIGILAVWLFSSIADKL
jgi:hypothetical protein